MKRLLPLLALLLIAGCTAPATRKPRKAPPLPPAPPGMAKMSMRPASTSLAAGVVAPPGQLVSARSIGGAVNDSGRAVVVDAQGNVITAGTADFRPLFSKRSPAGAVTWQFEPAGAGGGTVTSVAVDGAGNIFATGNFQGTLDFGGGPMTAAGSDDIFIAKFSPAGAHIWSKRTGGTTVNNFWPNDIGLGIAVKDDGSVFVVGVFDKEVNFGGATLTTADSRQRMFLVKLNADGSHAWSRSIGSASVVTGRAIALDADGLFVTGSFVGAADFGNGPVAHLGGLTPDAFVARYSAASGSLMWVKTYGVGGGTDAQGVSIAVAGTNVVMLGQLAGGPLSFGGPVLASAGISDIVLASYSAGDGSHRWSKSFGSSNIETPRGAAVDPLGRITITGEARGPIDFGGGVIAPPTLRSAFVAAFTSSGGHLWSRMITGNATGYDVDATTAGVFVVGDYGATTDFGGTSLTAAGLTDIFTAEFSTGSSAPDPADPNRTPMTVIRVPGAETMLVIITQGAGCTLELQRTDTFPATWLFLGSYGYSVNEQQVAIQIPAHWLSSDGVQERFFVKAINTPASPPAVAAAAAPLTDTGKNVTVKGVRYRLWLLKGGQFPTYRLVK